MTWSNSYSKTEVNAAKGRSATDCPAMNCVAKSRRGGDAIYQENGARVEVSDLSSS
jgi:hypothetical protein